MGGNVIRNLLTRDFCLKGFLHFFMLPRLAAHLLHRRIGERDIEAMHTGELGGFKPELVCAFHDEGLALEPLGHQFEHNQCRVGRRFMRLNVHLPVDHHASVDGARPRPVFAGFELVENDSLGLAEPIRGQ